MVKIGVAVLAAGKGTRLKLDIPKALCPLLGKTLIDFVLDELDAFDQNSNTSLTTGIVVGHLKEIVQKHLKSRDVQFAVQKEQLGTADALKSYFDGTKNAWDCDYTIICCADTPCLTQDIFSQMYSKIDSDSELMGVCASFITEDPTGYGRIIREGKGFKIVEEKDADKSQKKVNEVNSGLYIFRTSHIKEHLFDIDNTNNSGEYYLTDLVSPDFNVEALTFENASAFQGVNNLIQLENAGRDIQQKIIEKHQLNGVRFINSSTCYIEPEVTIAKGTVVYPGVVIEGKTTIGENCVLEANCVIKNSQIGNAVKVLAGCYFEEIKTGNELSIGPMARLRPGTVLEDKVKVGNFVEIKKAELKKGSKVSHLSYVGDAEIGEETNIGCGFITCNYDGANKHKTTIGKNSFIGSDCQTIAPVNIGDNAYIGSGSTINKDVPSDAFAIARERQVTKEGMAKKFLKK
jgi:bifunctional UDP-N-acetylglucosamine pyrophosphorylase/glucosamine-1-phosphate N-acetyltransferase